MASNLTVDSADKSSRWYITPGIASTYDLQVHNDTDRAVLCRVTLASHPDTGSVKPQSLTLQAHETRTVAVTFSPDAKLPRDRKAVIAVKDAAGQVLKTIERELVSGASTDATVDLSWKTPIVENDRLCGFVLQCTIRSLSGAADEFTPDFNPHASLRFPELAPVWLEPGETANLELPIRWDRAARDAEGWNHPRAIEAFVAVSQGRRSGRLSWDVVQRTIGDMLDRSDRSPVVERKAAAPSFTSGAIAPPAANSEPVAVVRDLARKENGQARPLEVVKAMTPAAATVAVPVEQSPQAAGAAQLGHQSIDVPKKARDDAAENAAKFDGYRPAYQLAPARTTNGAGSPVLDSRSVASDATIHVDDLDSSIVGSGLNYARNSHGEPQARRRPIHPAAWLVGIAAVALLGFALSRPHGPTAQSNTHAGSAAAPAVTASKAAAAPARARPSQPRRAAVRVAPKPKAAAPSPAAATPAPVAAAPAPAPTTTSVPVVSTARVAPARTAPRRAPPVDRSALPQIDFVDASYGRLGRAVRVQWNSSAQASADVQLTDARGTLIAERAVNGGRSSVLLGLPRGYHGGVYVQVSVTGYHNERVVQTSSLTPF